MKRCAGMFLIVVLAGWCAAAPATAPSTTPAEPQATELQVTEPQATGPQTTADADMAPAADGRIQQLIDQLNADAWAARQEAEEALVALGSSVLPHLEQAIQGSDDLEVRTRLRTILGRIERERALGTTRITLDLSDATLQEVLAEVSRQAGAPLRLTGSQSDRRVSYSFRDEPFWVVIQRICRDFDLMPSDSGDRQGGFALSRASAGQLKAPTVIHGPFLVALNKFEYSHMINLWDQETMHSRASLSMMVMAEPKLTILGRSYMPLVEEVTNEAGQSLEPGGVMHRGFGSGDGRIWTVNLPLSAEAARSRKIATLKGTIDVVVQVRAQSIEVTDILNVREQSYSVGPRRVILHEMAQKDGAYLLRLTVFHIPGEMAEIGGVASQLKTLQLFDANGQTFQGSGMLNAQADGLKTEFTVQFRRPSSASRDAVPTRLQWTLPIETRSLKIPFEFHDVTLQ